jgi:hypothetical protein
MSDVPRNPDGSFTLYNQDGLNVTLRFPAAPPAGFKVVTKDLSGSLPSGYTWLINFGVQNNAGVFLPSVSYTLEGTGSLPANKAWFVYYGGQPRPMNGSHTSPGDPPIGYG